MDIPSDGGSAVDAQRREPIPWLEKLNKVIGTLIEIPAAFLVLAEIIVLLTGVTSRYVFHRPLVWSDELASILFLWLAMLGSIIAFQRGEHMRRDGDRRQAPATRASPPGSVCHRGRHGFSRLRCPPGLRVRAGRGLRHDTGHGHRELLASRSAAFRSGTDVDRSAWFRFSRSAS